MLTKKWVDEKWVDEKWVDEKWLLLHIEIQNQKEAKFSQRVYIYSPRLFDKFRRAVASFTVLGDPDRQWRPQTFHQETLGPRVE